MHILKYTFHICAYKLNNNIYERMHSLEWPLVARGLFATCRCQPTSPFPYNKASYPGDVTSSTI